jgi:hypothetical protein
MYRRAQTCISGDVYKTFDPILIKRVGVFNKLKVRIIK